MRIYLTADGESFWGPMEQEDAWRQVQSGDIPKSASWTEATGQTHATLRATALSFRPLSDLWGPALETDPAAAQTSPPPAVQVARPPYVQPAGVELLRVVGGIWLFFTLIGAVLIVWQFGSVGTGYREEFNPVGWAIAITSAMQGFIVYGVCRVLADVRMRLEDLARRK
jgi:hypothetical protein